MNLNGKNDTCWSFFGTVPGMGGVVKENGGGGEFKSALQYFFN
jgi:hypothetical protein